MRVEERQDQPCNQMRLRENMRGHAKIRSQKRRGAAGVQAVEGNAPLQRALILRTPINIKGVSMRRCTFAIVLLIAFLAFPAAVSADMTYILNSFAADQNGWHLDGEHYHRRHDWRASKVGLRVMDLDRHGGIELVHLFVYRFSAALVIKAGSSIMTNATGTQILIPSTAGTANGLALAVNGVGNLQWDNSPPTTAPFYEAFIPSVQTFWDTSNPQMGGYEPWIIAGPLPRSGALDARAGRVRCRLWSGLRLGTETHREAGGTEGGLESRRHAQGRGPLPVSNSCIGPLGRLVFP